MAELSANDIRVWLTYLKETRRTERRDGYLAAIKTAAQGHGRPEGNVDADRRQEAGEADRSEEAGDEIAEEVGLIHPSDLGCRAPLPRPTTAGCQSRKASRRCCLDMLTAKACK
ncbi:hypothetical protein [Bradyrhizobium ivorense]|uniref:hypothetical protein n=1 Tax=Bradyrhizobium ivorense TaxID=2511166 RepID=UPI00155AABBA|nr:hypothetical protein [Bradyrhizobium ivorense]